jgi:hypothetical protein
VTAKKHSKAAAAAIEAIEPEELLSEEELLHLDYNAVELLERVMRLLVAIQTPHLVARARREGYTQAEHSLGQALWTKATGIDRPLDHFLSRSQFSPVEGSEGQRILQELDDFENIWFPRTRAIIRRAVPKDRRDHFEAGFFADLSQQPLGPQVVGSVTGFLARVAGLEASKQPDAQAVHTLLQQRGLTPGKLSSVRALLDQIANFSLPSVPANVADVRAADAAQREALEQLRDWYRDWTTTLRTLFPTSVQIRLGLTRRRRAAEESETEAPATEQHESEARS